MGFPSISYLLWEYKYWHRGGCFTFKGCLLRSTPSSTFLTCSYHRYAITLVEYTLILIYFTCHCSTLIRIQVKQPLMVPPCQEWPKYQTIKLERILHEYTLTEYHSVAVFYSKAYCKIVPTMKIAWDTLPVLFGPITPIQMQCRIETLWKCKKR